MPSPGKVAFCVCALALLACGCASVPGVQPGPHAQADAASPAKMISDFESRRNASQLAAARRAFSRGDFQQCQRELAAILKRAPYDCAAHCLRCETLLASGELELLDEASSQLTADFPNEAHAHFVCGLAHEALDRGPQALASFRQAAALAPENDTYHQCATEWESLLSGKP